MLARVRMQAFREAQEWSRSALARLLGFHPSYVGLIERGLRTPSPKFTRRLQALTAKVSGKKAAINAVDWEAEDAFEVPELPTHSKTVAEPTNGREVRS